MGIKTDSDQPVNRLVISDMPVTPPSKKWFGSKKPFNPRVAEPTPAPIKTVSKKNLRHRRDRRALRIGLIERLALESCDILQQYEL